MERTIVKRYSWFAGNTSDEIIVEVETKTDSTKTVAIEYAGGYLKFYDMDDFKQFNNVMKEVLSFEKEDDNDN